MPCTSAGFLIYRQIQPKNFEHLLLKSTDVGGHWTPPKGHLENAEDEKATAIRECREETGLSPSDLEIVDGFEKTLRYKVLNKDKSIEDKTVKYFLARLKLNDAPIKLSHEHSEFAWFNVKSLDNPLYKSSIHDDTKNLIRSAEEFLMKK